MSDPIALTLKATDKAGLVKNLRLGASLGWEVRYAMDRDHARLLADAIEACLEIEATIEAGRASREAATKRIEAGISRMRAENRKTGALLAVHILAAACILCIAWWAA